MLGLAAFIASTGALCIGLGTHHRMEGLIATALLMVALAGPGVFFSSYTGCLKFLDSRRAQRLSDGQKKFLGAALAALAAAAVDGSALTLRIVRNVSSPHTGCLRFAAIGWMVFIAIVTIALLGCFSFWDEPAGTYGSVAADLNLLVRSTPAAASRSSIRGCVRARRCIVTGRMGLGVEK